MDEGSSGRNPSKPPDEPAVPSFVLAPADEMQIREIAASELSKSFRQLTKAHVLPRPRYLPWIRIAHDYYGDMLGGTEALADALDAALPARFDRSHGPAMDYPWTYRSALLEAAVAAATLADEPYEVDSPSVQKMIDELVAKLQVDPRTTALQLLADVDVESAREGDRDVSGAIEFAGVRVISVGSEPERIIERELPSAGYEVERSQVLVHPGPASLFVATVRSTAEYSERVSEARRRLTRLISAVRLATGSTAHAVIEVAGDPGRVRDIHPIITPLPGWGMRFAHRPTTLSRSLLPGLTNLTSLLDSLARDENWMPIRIALGRLERSLDGRMPGLPDQAVDLSIGLEAALAGAGKVDVSLRLRTRAARILATESDLADSIYRDVKMLYDLRSAYVHGGSLSTKKVQKAIVNAAGPGPKLPAEQYLFALDRWRDLLRRAILARIALATAPTPWSVNPKKSEAFDVDEFLLSAENVSAWVDHIRRFWEEQGLPDVHKRPPPPRLTVG